LVIVEVNNTLVPAQTLLLVVEIVIVGAVLLFTVMAIPFDVAVFGLAHVELEVITQVTTSPVTSDELL
jgi:hypothetical protein